MSGRRWRVSERILLMVVVCFAALAVYRTVIREPASPTQEPDAEPSTAVAAQHPGPAAVAPPSAACAELLTRIRSHSSKDLEAIADKLSGAEALSLYRQLDTTDRQAVFSEIPVPLLARKAHELLGIPESSFHHAGRPGLLASDLVDIAMGAFGKRADSSGNERKELRFATAVEADGAPQNPRGTFQLDERKIYACLDGEAESGGEPGVLVRWIEERSDALVHLHYQPFAINRRWNFVYFEVVGVWTPGTYRVSFYRIGKSVGLLAEGTYVVQ